MFDEDGPSRGPGFWKFNNSLLMDTDYVELLTFKLPEFVTKHCQVSDKGLFWEMITENGNQSFHDQIFETQSKEKAR